MRSRPATLVTLLAALGLSAPACRDLSGPDVPPFDSDADVTILFVGNSLTYSNRLPAMVVTIAEAAGLSVDAAALASPNFSLEDHWRTGIANEIRSLRPDIVVMQQGPSSLEQNQLHLRTWADSLARIAREVGAEPALLMVWPSVERSFAFDAVLESYRAAAEAVDGTFIPAGDAWRTLWAEDEDLPLYGADGFHPSTLGSAVAALTVVESLFDPDLPGLPSVLAPSNPDLPRITLGDELAPRVYRAVEETVARHSAASTVTGSTRP